MSKSNDSSHGVVGKPAFLSGVFLITFSILVFQIVQTRILSGISWYALAFLAISVAMLGMTIGAVWVYLRPERFQPENLGANLTNHALGCAVSIPASLMVQFCLVTSISLTASTVISWGLLMAAMAVPYVFAGIVVSLALTRSPFPVSEVYGVDLLGAALGCVAVVLVLNVLDAPTTIVLTGLVAALSARCFAASATAQEQEALRMRSWWQRPGPVVSALLALSLFNALTPVGLRPILVKGAVEVTLIDWPNVRGAGGDLPLWRPSRTRIGGRRHAGAGLQRH
jgi:hypothetical protein